MPAERLSIAVTGANGFIGGALVIALQQRGHRVVKCVRPYQAKLGDIAWDLLSPPPEASFEGVGVVVHTAARVHVMNEAAHDPIAEFRRANVQGTLQLAEAAAQAGVRRFLFVSSIKVNGESTLPGQPFKPGDTPSPQDAYAVSKLEAEQALMALARRSTMEVVIVRPPLVYGPNAGGNVRQMLKWVKRGVPLPLGGINNRRSLVGLANLVSLLEQCIAHPAAAGHVFLAADSVAVSTSQLLVEIGRSLGRPARLFHVPHWVLVLAARLLGRAAWAERLSGSLEVDISKNTTVLGWQPAYGLAEGIRQMTAGERR